MEQIGLRIQFQYPKTHREILVGMKLQKNNFCVCVMILIFKKVKVMFIITQIKHLMDIGPIFYKILTKSYYIDIQ